MPLRCRVDLSDMMFCRTSQIINLFDPQILSICLSEC